MITSRGLTKCLLVAVVVGVAITLTVIPTAGLLLGLAIAVGSISLLPVASTEEAAPDQQHSVLVNPVKRDTPLDEQFFVTIAQPKQLPLSDTTERREDAHQSATRKR